MFRVFWRGFLLLLCALLVLVCFPDYPDTALIVVGGIFVAFFLGIALFTILLSFFGMWRSPFINAFFDLIMICAFILLLLLHLPQISGQTPMQQLLRGKYPKITDIELGFYKLGLGKMGDKVVNLVSDKKVIDAVDGVTEVIDAGKGLLEETRTQLKRREYKK